MEAPKTVGLYYDGDGFYDNEEPFAFVVMDTEQDEENHK